MARRGGNGRRPGCGSNKYVAFRNPSGVKPLQSICTELGGMSVTDTLGVLITRWNQSSQLDRKKALAEYGRLLLSLRTAGKGPSHGILVGSDPEGTRPNPVIEGAIVAEEIAAIETAKLAVLAAGNEVANGSSATGAAGQLPPTVPAAPRMVG